MYSVFRLLFRKDYWRMLGRRATWGEAKLNLLRAHKDKRARKQVLGFVVLVLVPFLCFAYAFWLAGSGAILLLPFVLPVMIWRERRSKRDAQTLTIMPLNKPTEISAEESRTLHIFLERLTFFFAVVLDRAGSESFLKAKTLPEGLTATTRRVHLDLLRNRGVWDALRSEDRNAMLAADGHWEEEEIYEARETIEPLRLLRWILRVDHFLPTLGQQLTWNYGLARELVEDPTMLERSNDMVSRDGLETGCDAAKYLFIRCVAEQIHRGRWSHPDESGYEWARGVSDELGGKQHKDFVLGTQLVSEANNDLLDWATRLSRQRMHFLQWVLRMQEGEPLPELLTGVFGLPVDNPLDVEAVDG